MNAAHAPLQSRAAVSSQEIASNAAELCSLAPCLQRQMSRPATAGDGASLEAAGTAAPADAVSSSAPSPDSDAPKPNSNDPRSGSSRAPIKLQQGRDFQAYDRDGNAVSLRTIVRQVADVDIVLMGEYHDDAMAHMLELELFKRVHKTYGVQQYGAQPSSVEEHGRQSALPAKRSNGDSHHSAAATSRPSPSGLLPARPQGHRHPPSTSVPHSEARPDGFAAAKAESSSGPSLVRSGAQPAAAAARRVVLSLEMFERDVQHVLDEYLSGTVPERDLRDARPWPNYVSDYRPLVEFAKSNGLSVVAANAPRRYVSIAGRRGELSAQALPTHDPTCAVYLKQ